MVDSTANVTESVLQNMKNFISYSMERFAGLDDSFMMGVMQYSTRDSSEIVRQLSRYTNSMDLDKILNGMKPQRGRRRMTGDALVEAGKTVSEYF